MTEGSGNSELTYIVGGLVVLASVIGAFLFFNGGLTEQRGPGPAMVATDFETLPAASAR